MGAVGCHESNCMELGKGRVVGGGGEGGGGGADI